ncbi:NAD(P)-dependent oxidoreductase [Paenibacillus sp. J22TS3]|uniref:NAD-dependent epimerase/dehydratase family protein n=1 Tax=Paenibacillus sp. J22TS3 TaxID=2807192 RepID=UPI001B0EA865|nr:NAD(P)-dependent oxidoreductase [Paenibacillus sp. J22TS3]GIP24118.1 UDP-2-acetamido-2,6-dideoxy-hexulose 4-reductase [Paenibacillus sp. J22TS3]
MSPNSVLITGAAGFTGRHACRYFADRGYRVIAVSRGPQMRQEPGVEYATCDLTDKGQIRTLIERTVPKYVLHLAGKNSVPESWAQPLLYMESNIMGTIYLLEALREFAHGSRVLVASSRLKFELHGELMPTHPYALSKSVQEIASLAWGKLFGQDVLAAEPGNLIGPGPSTGICALLARYIARGERGESQEVFRLSSAEEQRDFLDVRDAVAAYELLLLKGRTGSVTPVCSGVERRLGDVAKGLMALTQGDIQLEVGDAPANGGGRVIQPEHLRQLGWQPAYTWEQSLADILEYFRAERG